jgi:hypothetical protein
VESAGVQPPVVNVKRVKTDSQPTIDAHMLDLQKAMSQRTPILTLDELLWIYQGKLTPDYIQSEYYKRYPKEKPKENPKPKADPKKKKQIAKQVDEEKPQAPS